MNIEVVRHIPFEELEARVRTVPLKGRDADGSEIFVYSSAYIRVQKVRPDEVNPTTFYLLHKNLQFQRDLHAYLLGKGIDTLALDGALELHNKDEDKVWTLTPPIVEVTPRHVWYQPQEGEVGYMKDSPIANPCQRAWGIQIPIINDGLHRVAFAREKERRVKVLWISGADARYPFYAHPNSWDDVQVFDEVPVDKMKKKMYRLPNCYAVYRDFDVIGCGAPRSVYA